MLIGKPMTYHEPKSTTYSNLEISSQFYDAWPQQTKKATNNVELR